MDMLEPEDAACLRMLAGAHFEGNITLPSGRVMTTAEVQALTSAYAPALGEREQITDGTNRTTRAIAAEAAHIDEAPEPARRGIRRLLGWPRRDSAVEHYLAGGGDPHNARAIELMAEVDRGRARRAAEEQPAPERQADPNLLPEPKPTGDPIADAVTHAEWRAEVSRIRNKARQDEFVRNAARQDEYRAQFLANCRPAAAAEYATWLVGYLQAGGRITDIRSGSLADVWVLTRRPGYVPSLYGALSVNVIVPTAVDFTPADVPRTFHGDCGHSSFYFLRDFQIVGSDVPLYGDVKPLLTA